MKYRFFLKPKGWRTNILLVSVALVSGVFITHSLLREQQSTQNTPPTTSVPKITDKKVAALGYLEPQGEVIQIDAPSSNQSERIERLLVKQGDKVKTGQVIAILDSRDSSLAEFQIAQKQVKVAQARLAQVQAGAKKSDILAQNAKFQQTKAELAGQVNIQKATIAELAAQLQGEQNAQQATIERFQAELNNSQSDCSRYQSLYRKGTVSEQSRDNNCLKEETNRKQIEEAQANLNRIVTSRGKQIEEAQANLNRTISTQQRQIEEAQATLDATAEVRLVDVQVANAELQQALADVQKAKADLALAYIKAPKDGQILKIHTWPGESVDEQGIVELGRTSQMYVRAEVYETDITKVRIGQRAKIQSDGIYGILGDLQGTVAEIGLSIGKKDVLGTDPVADADARVVEVKICLDSKDSQQVAGLTNLQVKAVINTVTSTRQ
jgi:HlyD family secretion protein